MYRFKSRIRYSEVDACKKLDLSSIINYFQDCTIFHSEDVGLGQSFFQTYRRTWIISSWQVNVLRYPKLFEEITISTYLYDIKGFMGFRNFQMTDNTGETCAIADSTWIYMNTDTMKPTRVAKEDLSAYNIGRKLDMEYKKGKILLPENLDKLDPFPVLPSMIDSNHHVNNSQYVTFASNYLPEHFHPTEMRVEYRNAAKIGDIIYPLAYTSDTVCTISLTGVNGKPFAVLEFVS